MDALNQTMFAFASYNAGPGRIRSLRRIAKQRGYDPNVRFNNVEVITAEKTGAEIFKYVANIYEYYVAYTLFEAQKKKKEESVKDAIPTGKLKWWH